jgi:predicted DNA-binding transcriptional regulator AlpA
VAAARLGVSHSWFWSQVKEGKLPRPKKIGQRMSLWHVADLDAAFTKLLAAREPTKAA